MLMAVVTMYRYPAFGLLCWSDRTVSVYPSLRSCIYGSFLMRSILAFLCRHPSVSHPHSLRSMCLQCVRTNEVGIVEDLGQFRKLIDPGLHFICWPLTAVAGRLTLRIQQLDVICETKTKDNVFVQVAVAVQYRVLVGSAYDAYYRLSDPRGQIQSYVFDVVRSSVPRMELDDAFASKADIAAAVMAQLHDVMKDYGERVLHTCMTLRTAGSLFIIFLWSFLTRSIYTVLSFHPQATKSSTLLLLIYPQIVRSRLP